MWLSLEERFQVGEFAGPEETIVAEPVVDRAEGFGIEVIVAMAADTVFPDQAGTAKQAKVLGNRGARDGEGAGDLASGLMAAAKEAEDSAASGIGEGAEDGIPRMSNRTVSHNV